MPAHIDRRSVDYSSQTYWDSRFSHERTFEWLAPSSGILPRISHVLEDMGEIPLARCKIVHIGCGNSELSLDLRRFVSDVPEVQVLNIDYAAAALKRMQDTEIAKFGDSRMRWEVVNLLDWDATRKAVLADGIIRRELEPEMLVVVDKSCSDAIACGEDVETPLNTTKMHPMQALTLHLGATAAPGSIWIALSHSPERFDFLPLSNDDTGKHLWEIIRTEKIPAQTGLDLQSRINVHAPEIYHTLFTLRRTPQNV
ncbi:Methyltransferase domain-containing protein [Ceratobasidium theobromae]|uniref:Methyltransferase domain-containing protein n=1 Tax=Ceratobasidium theobromae TaxID=1582974 RepID=A0A5N5Q9F8_9AGAM|nr:Methyltransferase domain-containing protein [Ceratobasidium theobromae]